ncbi:MAG: DUF3866 family protein [Actinomycetota bacterium]|nr:DUF3866 family protein [Actinomycetota bacterium]
MATFAQGSVVEVLERRNDLVRVRVDLEGEEVEAAAFPHMVGPPEVGDRVVLNTTGLALGLGTGGTAFVLWNLDRDHAGDVDGGHIVKMRYTPWQSNVLAAEAPESPHHESLADADSISGVPVVVCGLHSQMPAAAAGIKQASPGVRVGYLMTDGAALPLAWSRLVQEAKGAGLIDVTATAGHAFGGDLEAVNVFSALAALRHAGRCDAIVAAMGPGVVGTGTTLGHTALEQGQILDAVTALGGEAIACLRVSFADSRERQRGISHHTLTALRVAAREQCRVVLPDIPEQLEDLHEQLVTDGADRHEIVVRDGSEGLSFMIDRGLRPTSMGRTVEETPELFLAAAAAGRLAGERVVRATDPEEPGA